MTRKEFIKLCSILGVGLPLQSTMVACDDDDMTPSNFNGKVLIIGAGAGGLSTGHFLRQRNIDFEILEASATYGGRMRTNTTFADFPIPLGAEWLHAGTNVFEEIVNDSSAAVSVETTNYNSATDTLAAWQNGQLVVEALDDSDIKFVNYSWFDFFEQYILPSVTDQISYNSIVQSIDYSGEQITVQTQNGTHTADKVIITVPLKILQDGDINFTPAFPSDKLSAINDLPIWEGFKAFIEFSEKFYDTQISFEVTPETAGQKLYYDAAYGQNSSKNILGVFSVGTPAQAFGAMTDDELRDFVLGELDQLYDNQATPNYISHIVQNWNEEPFIKAGYLSDHADWRMVRKLSEPIDDKLFFAGGPYTDGEDWVSVHVAAQSAKVAVDRL